MPAVGIVMGSDSDFPVIEHALTTLKKFNVPYEVSVLSAHRSPQLAITYARNATKRGLKVIIAAAGGAAHLAGLIAANTTAPVIGVPLATSELQGMDALFSTVQMPSGVPVATVSVGKAGAVNAAVLAVQILGVRDAALQKKLKRFKKELTDKVKKASHKVSKR